MNITLTIQEKLKDLRVERGLGLEELAAATGISKSSLGKYESDDYKDISPFNLVKLAEFYGVSTDYLDDSLFPDTVCSLFDTVSFVYGTSFL